MKSLKPHLFILSVILVLLVGRCMFLGSGYLEDTDELPFLALLEHAENLWKGSAEAWNRQVIGLWSTYPETAMRLLQSVFLNSYADWKDISNTSTGALLVIGAFNLLISLLIAIVLYKILLQLSFSRNLSALGVLLYGTLLNTNLYIRHILPYDCSLLFHLVAVYFLLKDPQTRLRTIWAGLFCGLGFYTYYGNFMFLFITWAILLYQVGRDWKLLVSRTVLFAAPSLVMLLFLEWLSQQSGRGYILHTIIFSDTIFHGSPEEGLTYLFKYFSQVEGRWGIFFLLLFFSGVVLAVPGRGRLPGKLRAFLGLGIVAYLLYGIYAVTTGHMVFYGRVLHMYYPFLAVGALVLLNRYRFLVLPVAIAAVLHFAFVVRELNSIGYPRSMVFEYSLFDGEDKTQFVNELRAGIIYDYRMKYFHEEDFGLATYQLPQPAKFNTPVDSLILLNFGFFYHYPDDFMDTYRPFSPPDRAELVVERLHFMSHPAYTFEYNTKYGRAFMLEKTFFIKLYRIKQDGDKK